MNIQERIEALETEFNEKIKALKAEAQREDEFPRDGDDYWYLDITGEVINKKWGGFASEEGMLKIGNIFRTKQQAEFAVEKLKVEAELRKFSTSFVLYNENWFLVLADTQQDVMPLYENREVTQGTIYFESKERAEEAVKSVGEDRIKKYIFGVED